MAALKEHEKMRKQFTGKNLSGTDKHLVKAFQNENSKDNVLVTRGSKYTQTKSPELMTRISEIQQKISSSTASRSTGEGLTSPVGEACGTKSTDQIGNLSSVTVPLEVAFQGGLPSLDPKSNSFITAKTSHPVSYINELCQKLNYQITTEFQSDGPNNNAVHECIMTIITNSGVIQTATTAKTKKDAKLEAARQLILQADPRLDINSFMAEKQRAKLVNACSERTEEKKSQMTIDGIDGDVSGNPIGDLLHLCAKAKIPAPEYRVITDLPPDFVIVNTITFKIECRISNNLFEVGTGTTKKHAKRVAAAKMLARLDAAIQDSSLLFERNNGTISIPSDVEEISRRLGGLSLNKGRKSWAQPNLTSQSKNIQGKDFGDGTAHTSPKRVSLANEMNELKQLYLQDNPRRALQLLKGLNQEKYKTCEPMLLLQEICLQENYIMEHLDLPSLLNNSEGQCSPGATTQTFRNIICVSIGENFRNRFYGEGKCEVEARRDAAEGALKFLRNIIM